MSQQLHQSPHCNRSFTKKNRQEQHLPTQSDDCPSKCNHYASSFAQKVTLMDHPHTNTVSVHTSVTTVKAALLSRAS
ncbi:hypothetical protein V5799_034476 [Amblyomma americanum]|uniref:Uncharacterized protein n=1 Tax=Amblyomma americanum TaxID=6943 RepID=A0AAQ4DKC6_AMBAM